AKTLPGSTSGWTRPRPPPPTPPGTPDPAPDRLAARNPALQCSGLAKYPAWPRPARPPARAGSNARHQSTPIDMDPIESRIRTFLQEQFPVPEQLPAAESLLDSGIIDSIGVLTL